MILLALLLNLSAYPKDKERFIKVILDCSKPQFIFTCTELRYTFIKRNIYLPYNNLEIISKDSSYLNNR